MDFASQANYFGGVLIYHSLGSYILLGALYIFFTQEKIMLNVSFAILRWTILISCIVHSLFIGREFFTMWYGGYLYEQYAFYGRALNGEIWIYYCRYILTPILGLLLFIPHVDRMKILLGHILFSIFFLNYILFDFTVNRIDFLNPHLSASMSYILNYMFYSAVIALIIVLLSWFYTKFFKAIK